MAVEQADRRLVDRRTQHLLAQPVMMAILLRFVPGPENLGTINPTRLGMDFGVIFRATLRRPGINPETGRKNHPAINKARRIRGRGNAMHTTA